MCDRSQDTADAGDLRARSVVVARSTCQGVALKGCFLHCNGKGAVVAVVFRRSSKKLK